ncbi:MAG: hypothetical protein AB9903_26075 [Vulcanimicrobiota bacterium]
MREIHTDRIVNTVSSLCLEVCLILPDDVAQCISLALDKEQSPPMSHCAPQ